MAAINPNDLAKFTWILEIRPAWTSWAYSRLASVRWLVANLDTSNVVEVNADDTWTVLKVTNQITTIETELLEVYGRDTLALLFNWTSTDVAWTPVTVQLKDLWTGWTVDNPIKLVKNIEVWTIEVHADWTTLTLDTDYRVYVWDDGYAYIYPITEQTWVLTANYIFTLNEREEFITQNDTQQLKDYELKITATSDGKDRTITVSSATLSSTYGMSFQDVVENGNITGASLTFTSNKWSFTKYYNEII